MNRDTFSRFRPRDCQCHCCHQHHETSDSQGEDLAEATRILSSSQCPHRDPSAPRKAWSDPQTTNRPSDKNGRRRSESAPDALLDCLHCGKDLPAALVKKRRHARRNTVTSAGRCCPVKATSAFKTSNWSSRFPSEIGQRRRFQNTEKCPLCIPCIHCRESGTGSGSTTRKPLVDEFCWICEAGDTCATKNTTNISFNESQAFLKRGILLPSSVKKHLPRKSADFPPQTPRCFVSKISCSTDDDLPCRNVEGTEKLRRRSVDFDYTTLKQFNLEDDTTNDDDNEIPGGSAINVNENRRRKSLTCCVEHGRGASGKSASLERRKRRSYLGLSRKKKSCVFHMDNLLDSLDQSVRPACTHNVTTGSSHSQAAHDPPGPSTRPDRGRLTASASEEGGEEADEEASESADNDVQQDPAPRDSLLMNNLNNMWRRHRLCDVILRSNGQEIPAHKLALAAFSENFARRYCERESGADVGNVVVIDVPDSTLGGVQEVLRFVYTGDIRLTPDNVANVLSAAAFLQIEQVVDLCKQMLLQPDVETVVFFSQLAEKYQLGDIQGVFYDFICQHFLRVSRTSGWKTLTFSKVFDLLSEDNLCVERELDVFHAAVNWIVGDRENRLTFAADLIGCVRFTYVTPDEIAKHVESKQFLFQGDEGKELLLCIYRHHALQTCGCVQGQRMHRLPPRQYRPQVIPRNLCKSAHSASMASTTQRKVPTTMTSSSCDVILSVGGVNPFHPKVELQSRLVEQFDPRENRWATRTRLPDGRHHHGVALLESAIFVIGGSVLDELNPEHLCNPTTSCYRYDLTSGQWSAVAPLNTPRMYHATAVLNDVIFVVAGQTQNSKHLSSMECYRPEVDEWEMGVSMREARIGVAVASYRGQLMAVGGFLETQHEHVVRATVEVFDPLRCRWSSLSDLPSPRCHAGLVECVGKLYLVGGSTFPSESPTVCSLPSVLRYEENEDRWDRVQTLQTPRHDMGIAVLGCRIFIVGGVSSTENKVLSDVECYDVEGDYWLDDVEPIRSPALGLVCVTVLADN